MAIEKYLSDYEAKALICEYGKRLYARELVDGNGGNISCRVGPNAVWVTPTMESKGSLTPDMLIKMDLDGNILLPGAYRPSSETKMHLGLYKLNEDAQVVVHAHPPYATAFAMAGIEPPAVYLPEATLFFGETIPLADFAMPGTTQMVESIAPYARTHKAVLLRNHGALTWGTNIKEAYFMMETLENYCRVYIYADKLLGRLAPMPAEAHDEIMKQHDAMMWK